MLHITRDLDLALDAPVGLSRVMRHLVYRHGYEAACALLLDPHTDALVPVVATGARKKITKQSLELANKAILSGELAVQLSSIPRRPDSQALLRAVPLSGPLGVEGVLLLRSRQDHDLHETAFVEQLGMTVGHWLTHSRSHQQLRRLADHLNRSGREVSRRLALAGGRS